MTEAPCIRWCCWGWGGGVGFPPGAAEMGSGSPELCSCASLSRRTEGRGGCSPFWGSSAIPSACLHSALQVRWGGWQSQPCSSMSNCFSPELRSARDEAVYQNQEGNKYLVCLILLFSLPPSPVHLQVLQCWGWSSRIRYCSDQCSHYV